MYGQFPNQRFGGFGRIGGAGGMGSAPGASSANPMQAQLAAYMAAQSQPMQFKPPVMDGYSSTSQDDMMGGGQPRTGGMGSLGRFFPQMPAQGGAQPGMGSNPYMGRPLPMGQGLGAPMGSNPYSGRPLPMQSQGMGGGMGGAQAGQIGTAGMGTGGGGLGAMGLLNSTQPQQTMLSGGLLGGQAARMPGQFDPQQPLGKAGPAMNVPRYPTGWGR